MIETKAHRPHSVRSKCDSNQKSCNQTFVASGMPPIMKLVNFKLDITKVSNDRVHEPG